MAKKIDRKKLVKEIAEEVLRFMNQKVKVKAEEIKEGEGEGAIRIQIESDDPGILIGWKGRNLQALQHVIGLMLSCQTEEWTRVIVDINNYRDEQKARVEDLALRAAQQVKESGEAVMLGKMSAYERRLVHTILAEDKEVATHSEYEGEERRVIISLAGAENPKEERTEAGEIEAEEPEKEIKREKEEDGENEEFLAVTKDDLEENSGGAN